VTRIDIDLLALHILSMATGIPLPQSVTEAAA
jgi:hypothetical protein